MVGYYNQGVPTAVDLENNSSQKKYTINQTNKKGLVISKSLCVLMAIGAFLLALLVGLIVFFLVPRYCNGEKPPEALTQTHSHQLNNNNSNTNKDVVTNKADKGSLEKQAEEDVDERLPRSIEPTQYEIRILPNFNNYTTSGTVGMTLKVVKSTNDIIFHLRDIAVLENSVSVLSTEADSSKLEVIKKEYLPGDKYKISLKHHLKTGGEYKLYLDYKGELNRHLKGFYASTYNDARGQERVIASTQFSPIDARQAFPCFDEPSFKANFTIILARPANMTTLSNMPLLNSTVFNRMENGIAKRSIRKRDSGDVWYWDRYPETPKMSSYLVAFMVTDLKPRQSPDPLMTFWAREELVAYTEYAAELGPKILRYYENYFDIKFPLDKIDIVALPSFGFAAMENWGLITYRESSLLYEPPSSSIIDKRGIATTLAHELAHQWFGNLVTPKFWNDLWVKEGFANYLVYMGVNQAEPKWKFLEEFVISETKRAMAEDVFNSSRPLSKDEVKNSRQIRPLFDSISYAKGAAIVKMMNHFLGEETFKTGLINFLKKYQYSNADRQNLFDTLTEEAHKNEILNPNESVKTIMDTWTDRPGFPVINAVPNYELHTLKISQKRYYLSEIDENSNWWVPLSFTTNASDNNPNFTDTLPKFWLKGETEIEKDVNITYYDWYLLNLQQTGYFIVNYEKNNWEKLSENIMSLTPEIRAQLISDSMDLAKANLLDYDIPLTMIANMAIQDSQIMFVPTYVAFNKLDFLSTILTSTPAFGHFEEYHKNIFQDTYKKVILEDTIDDYITRRIRILVLDWSCRSPDSRCTHLSKTLFREWIVRGRRIETNLRSTVYCTAIREGGEIEWDFAYRNYLQTSSPSEKNVLLDALGCTRLRWLLSRYLEKLLDDNSIRIQDADRVFSSVVNNEAGTQIAFDFLRKNWDAIIKHHGDGFNIVSRMVKSLGSRMKTEFELSELIRFRDSVKTKLSTAEEAFEQVIERVKSNVEWMEKNYNEVEEWLQNNRDLRTRIREKLKMEQYLQETNRGARRA